jgi:DNA-binding transcriptional LysR family regulator
VTRLVAGLEARLGVRLLQRTTRAVSLTDPGARFLERARRILAELEEAERLAESEQAAPAGRLVVSAPWMFGRRHVAPLVCDFMQQYPQVVCELQLNDRIVNLVEEGIDLALRIGHLEDSSDVARRMGATRRVVVASADYLDRAGTPACLQDLAGHRTIACIPLAPAGRWRFGPAAAPREIALTPSFVTNSVEAALWHAGNGGGLVQVLGYQVADEVRAGAMRIVLEELEPEPLPIHFVFPSSRLLSVKVRTLIDLARETRDWSFIALRR